MSTNESFRFKLRTVTPKTVLDMILEVATDLEHFRSTGCTLELTELTLESVRFRVVLDGTRMFRGEATRNLNDQWNVEVKRLTRTGEPS